jgi:membrane protein
MARVPDAALALSTRALGGLKNAGTLLARTYLEWSEDHATQYGAAMAYYMFFSLAPLLILAVAFAGAFFGAEAAEGTLVEELQYFIGRDGAEAIQALVWRARGSRAGLPLSLAGVGALLFGAAQVFNSLQTALNRMWHVPDGAVARGIKRDLIDFAKKRALSFAMVLIVGVLLVVSLLLNAALAAIESYLSRLGRDSADLAVLQFSDVALSLFLLTCLLAVIYKLLPDVRIAWGDVWFGAIVTSCLLTVGKLILAWYLGGSGIASVYGAAGSLVLILIWVYYCCQILLFGAEMTQVYAWEFGSRSRKKPAATAG